MSGVVPPFGNKVATVPKTIPTFTTVDAPSKGTPLRRRVSLQTEKSERERGNLVDEAGVVRSTGKLIDTRQTTIRMGQVKRSQVGMQRDGQEDDKNGNRVFNVKLNQCLLIRPHTRHLLRAHKPITYTMNEEDGKTTTETQKELKLQEDVMFLGSRDNPHGIYIGNIITNLTKKGDESVLAEIVNMSNKPIRLRTGMVLGRLEEFKKESAEEYYRFTDKRSELVINEEAINIKQVINFDETVLNNNQKQEILNLLEKYEDRFAGVSAAPPPSDLIQHHIDTDGSKPIKSGPARASYIEQIEINKQVDTMLKAGIIVHSESPWASRVVMVKKKDGTLRFCVDYRKLNELTTKDSYPVPIPRDIFDSMEGSSYFSTLDLASGYWQIPLTKEAQQKTAFVTRNGLYEFTRMPFGVTNGPASFQRMMQLVLAKMYGIYALVYVDDTIVYSPDWETHLIHLEEIFKVFRRGKLVVKLEKCRFGRKEVPFLGHIIDAEGIKVDPAKVKAMVNMRSPVDKNEVRIVMGMFNYYRQFFKAFSNTAYPINRLLKKDVQFKWYEEQEQAFNKLKRELTEAPVLHRPNFKKTFYLVTDASAVGIGAVVEQEGNDPLVYYKTPNCILVPNTSTSRTTIHSY